MSKARSPRDVCSITIGMSGLSCGAGPGRPKSHPAHGWRLSRTVMRPPPPRPVSTTSRRPAASPSRASTASRAREVGRDTLHLGGEPVERGAQPEVLPELLAPAVVHHLLDDLVGILLLLG